MATNAPGRRCPAELKAMAYHLADLIETRALALQKRNPALSFEKAMHRAIVDMAQGSRSQA